MGEIQIKKVLSIDMDFIMGPCIQLYNDLVYGYQNEVDLWKTIQEIRDIQPHLEYDKNKLAFIFDIFTKAVMNTNADKVMFARNHDAILNLLCTEEGKNYVYDVVNIDHHHDIFYSEDSKREVENFEFASLSNWVWYLNTHNRLRKYIWVQNENSSNFTVPDENFILDFLYQETTDYSHPELWQDTYDYVFVCCSPEWYPEQFKHFFLIMRQLASNLKQTDYEIQMDRYCVDEKSRPYEILNLHGLGTRKADE